MSSPSPTRPLLLLRCDVSAVHGTGHLMRAQALADAWRRRGGRAEFVATTDFAPYRAWIEDVPVHRLAQPAGTRAEAAETRALAEQMNAAWVLADGYEFDGAWQEGFGKGRCRLLLMDDYGHGTPYLADCVLNQNPGTDAALYTAQSPETRLLLGPRFALLRAQFASSRGWRRATPKSARRLLVTFGGTDPTGLTVLAAEALRETGVEAALVVGGGNSRSAEIEALCLGTPLQVRRNVTDMPALMAECDFVLCAAGSTTLECAFMQLPQILVTAADNQLRLADALVAEGAAELLGWHTGVTREQIATAVQALAHEPERRAAMAAAGARLVDGWGAERVVTHLQARMLTLRHADERDERATWEWANDPVTRASFFNNTTIPWEEHREWFRRRLVDPRARLWMAEDESGAALGLVRFAWADGEHEASASVVVAPAARGRGHGAAIVLRGSHKLLKSAPVESIHAHIRLENEASRKAFVRAGYQSDGVVEVDGTTANRFTLRAADLPIYERL